VFNLLPCDAVNGTCDEEAGLCLNGECALKGAAGGLKTEFEVELVRGLRDGFETEGMGA
jgi:hypothetical protein